MTASRLTFFCDTLPRGYIRLTRGAHSVAVVQRRQTGDRRAVLLLGTTQLVELLEVDPELARRPEDAPQPQRCIAGDGATSVDDFGDAVDRMERVAGLRECAPAVLPVRAGPTDVRSHRE